MSPRNLFIAFFLIIILGLNPISGFSQQVKNVLEAFDALSSDPEIIILTNEINVHGDGGHFQGVQLIEKNGTEKLLISGSSHSKAYVLQVDLPTRKTERLITLMNAPFRHAGGIQVSQQYMAVGIEDNFAKTSSKVCLYNYHNENLVKAQPNLTIDRKGEPKQQTAGSTGLVALDSDFLMVVSNWDSRNWDFYSIDPKKNAHKILTIFSAPSDWPSYQSINLIMDEEAIYAIGFYQKELVGYADLILVSRPETFQLIMEKVLTKAFNCKNGVDFGTAAGLQIDKEGSLHIWGTQRDPLEQIVLNRFSQQ